MQCYKAAIIHRNLPDSKMIANFFVFANRVSPSIAQLSGSCSGTGTLDQQQFLQMAHEGIVSSVAHLIGQPHLAPMKNEV